MALVELLSPDAIAPALKVGGKKQALQELASHAAGLTGLDQQAIFETLLQRERLGSTGVGEGIAIPHGKLARLDRLFGFVARLEKPIDFDAIGEDANSTTLAKYVLSDRGSAIRDFCEDEAVVVADALGRQAARRLFDRAATAPGVALRRLPLVGARLEKALPDPATTPAPLLLPDDGAPNFLFASPREVLDAVAPPLNRDDELYALDVTKARPSSAK